MKKLLFVIIVAIGIFILIRPLVSCNGGTKPSAGNSEGPKSITYSVVNTYPHDTSSFTEGLLFYKGDLYESTGLPGKSKLKKVDLKTGNAIKSINLDSASFGEGIVVINDTIYQLTYQQKVGYMYSAKDFKKLGEFKFNTKSGEGWGMTTDGKQIIATDGTSQLYYYEPGTFRLLKTQDVTEEGSLSFNLNELEYINGYVYANQWQQPYILKIDPNNGQIVGKINFTSLCDAMKIKDEHAEVFNGIAYDSTTNKIYVTGKLWPELYEVQFGQ